MRRGRWRLRWRLLTASARRGLTLIELMVAIGLIVLLLSLGMLGINSIRGADVSATTSVLSGAMQYVYTLAVHHNRTYRLVIDMDNRLFYTEAAADDTDPCSRYLPEGAEADPGAAAEGVAEEGDEGELGEDGQPKRSARFAEDDSVLLTEAFRPETNVTAIITEHHREPQTSGRAAIYFYPSGRAERAMVWVGENEGEAAEPEWAAVLTLEVHSLGRITRHNDVVPESDFMRDR